MLALLLAAAVTTSAGRAAVTTTAGAMAGVDLQFEGSGSGCTKEEIRQYVDRAAQAVTLYFGHFPVKKVIVDVTLGTRDHIGHGVTYMGWKIRINVGRNCQSEDLADDWRMTHEMFHLAFPDLDDDYLYLEEGLSTYLEPIARARAGQLTDERVWDDMADGMEQGLPGRGDQGLDHTHTWGRTYWGGCLFWLQVDVAIRERTQGKKSLDDAIRAILAAGGDGSKHWSIEKVIRVGDEATGTTVLQEMHETYGLKATATDLDALWKKLGVERTLPHGVALHDDAPDGAIRKAITGR
jgi:predicted metalloprotease with PDZ domain